MKLWKENKVDQEYELTHREILDRFEESSFYEMFEAGFPLERALSGFITSPEGLNSTYESDDWPALAEAAGTRFFD